MGFGLGTVRTRLRLEAVNLVSERKWLSAEVHTLHNEGEGCLGVIARRTEFRFLAEACFFSRSRGQKLNSHTETEVRSAVTRGCVRENTPKVG